MIFWFEQLKILMQTVGQGYGLELKADRVR
jgi:hypothetical protein